MKQIYINSTGIDDQLVDSTQPRPAPSGSATRRLQSSYGGSVHGQRENCTGFVMPNFASISRKTYSVVAEI